MEKLEILKRWIAESDHIVFFGGAGVSTESGIACNSNCLILYYPSTEVAINTLTVSER